MTSPVLAPVDPDITSRPPRDADAVTERRVRMDAVMLEGGKIVAANDRCVPDCLFRLIYTSDE